MKKTFVVLGIISMALVMGFFLTGCASSPLVNTFMDRDIAVTNHAVLSVHQTMNIAMIDGVSTMQSGGVSTKAGGITISAKTPTVLLTPGKHTIRVQYADQNTSWQDNYSGTQSTQTTTRTATGFIDVSGDFAEGRFYHIYPDVKARSVSFNIIDETDPNVWDTKSEKKAAAKRISAAKKKLASAAYPAKEVTAVRVQRAMASSPTPLEGTWVQEIHNDGTQKLIEHVYTFTGKAFLEYSTVNLTQDEIAQQNAARAMAKLPPVTSTVAKAGLRGLIEINGNSLTLTPLEASPDGGVSWTSMDMGHLADELGAVKTQLLTKMVSKQLQQMQQAAQQGQQELEKINSTYTYTVSPDGNLILVNDSGESINFTRQQ